MFFVSHFKIIMTLKLFLHVSIFFIDKMHNIKIPHKNKSFFLFSISACPFDKNLMNFKSCDELRQKKLT